MARLECMLCNNFLLAKIMSAHFVKLVFLYKVKKRVRKNCKLQYE